MIKRILTMTLVLALTLGMAACGGKNYMGTYEYNLDDYVVLGEYKGLEYKSEKITVTDEEIQAEIKARLEAAKGKEGFKLEMKDEAVEIGDTLNIDFEGKLNGVSFEGGTSTNFDLEIGSGQFIPGFEEGLVGKKIGETVDLNVTFPEGYGSAELAGKPVVFTVKINGGNRPIAPEYNLDFVTGTTEYKTIEEFEASVKQELESIKEENALTAMQNTLWGMVVEGSEIKGYPEGEVDVKKKDNMDYYTSYAQQSGMDLTSFVQAYFGMNEEEFQEYMDSYSKAVIDQEMVMYAVAKEENIGISEKEYGDLILLTLKEQGFESDEAFKTASGASFEDYAGKENLQKTFLLEKIIKFIVDEAKISK